MIRRSAAVEGAHRIPARAALRVAACCRDCDQVQVCTPANRDYLLSFLPRLAPRCSAGLRAGIDTAPLPFRPRGREPLTMLFLGSFRHEPNRVALDWFIRRGAAADSGAAAAARGW